VQLPRHAGPELFGVLDGLLVESLVLLKALDVGLALNSSGGGKTRFSRSVESMSRFATDAGKLDMHDPLGERTDRGLRDAERRRSAREAPAQTLSGGTWEEQVHVGVQLLPSSIQSRFIIAGMKSGIVCALVLVLSAATSCGQQSSAVHAGPFHWNPDDSQELGGEDRISQMKSLIPWSGSGFSMRLFKS